MLVDRLQTSPVAVEYESRPDRGFLLLGGVVVTPTDGRTATRLVADEVFQTADVVVDLFRSNATRVAFSVADQASERAATVAVGLLRSAGLEPSAVDDTPGLILMRIVVQLASVAADAVLLGVASAPAIDTAMRLGANYPAGPIEWADDLGAGVMVAVLDNLALHYGEERYRASAWLRRAALTGGRLQGESGLRAEG